MTRAKKRFGQHFLSNPHLLDRIAAALDPQPGDRVLEIGPGHGALTAALLGRGARVTALEVDRDLIPGLVARFPDVAVVAADALDVDWHDLAGPGDAGRWLIAGNIPYNITTPLIDKALAPPRPAAVVFLVQKEVADRVTARPGTAAYGALSVGVQAVARAERVFVVPAGAFQPPPRVDSAVIRLTPLAPPLVTDREVPAFRRMVTGLFSYRRKQLLRGLRELTGWPAVRAVPVLAGLGLDTTVRPEVLAPAAFVALFRALVDAGWSGE
ncbi:MAG TPA: 16S rRNA (adenine(1518)-N(6)/adenine(1519)-N(6))-dimethyltransferase RsmA [Gemmatimonadales bacterium]